MEFDIIWKIFVILYAIAQNCRMINAADINDDYYIAGVLEYSYIDSGKTLKESTKLNLEEYIKFIELAKRKDVDILVFPEATLNYDFVAKQESSRDDLIQEAVEIPDPELKIAPHDHPSDYSYILVELSRSAHKNQIYVLVNLIEKIRCVTDADICKPPLNVHNDGYSLYNVNIVFDRMGRIISRYRKQNLFVEPRVDELLEQPLPVFETDFGVKFGHFICFDILFKYPARALVQQENVTNILYPTYWYNLLPFFISESMHQGWAFSNDVNFLVSGANKPLVGSGGAGIYFGRKRIQVTETTTAEVRKLYTAKVPKNVRADYSFDEPTIREGVPPSNLLKMGVMQLWLATNPKLYPILRDPETICVHENKLCCTVDIKMTERSVPSGADFYRYVLVVDYTNKMYSEKRNVSEIACAIISCSGDTLDSCAQRIDENDIVSKTKFDHIKITAKIHSDSFDDIMIMPNTATTDFLPFDIANYTWTSTDTYEEKGIKYQDYTIESSGDISEFLTYGIYGRDFRMDAGLANDLKTFYNKFECGNSFCRPKSNV